MRSVDAHIEGVNGFLVSNDDIKDLIQIFIESGVAEMEVKRGENSLRLRRSFGQAPDRRICAARHDGPRRPRLQPAPVSSALPRLAAPCLPSAGTGCPTMSS